MFDHIDFLTLRASFTALENGKMPAYLGSTIRGILGHCLRSFVCETPQLRCNLCEKRSACSYAACFCSPGNEGGAVNPFVLYVLPRGKTEWQPGDEFSFDITVIGRVTQQAGVFLDAIQAMEKRGWGASRLRFQLDSIIDLKTQRLLYSDRRFYLRNVQAHPLAVAERSAASAFISFQTPVRILLQRELCRVLPFEILIRSISRRLALLSQGYTAHRIEWDEAAMLDAAAAVKTVWQEWWHRDFTRYSMNHEGNKLQLEAIEGKALYEGDLTPFVPLLEAGKVLHAGKNATIGFGRYETAYDR